MRITLKKSIICLESTYSGHHMCSDDHRRLQLPMFMSRVKPLWSYKFVFFLFEKIGWRRHTLRESGNCVYTPRQFRSQESQKRLKCRRHDALHGRLPQLTPRSLWGCSPSSPFAYLAPPERFRCRSVGTLLVDARTKIEKKNKQRGQVKKLTGKWKLNKTVCNRPAKETDDSIWVY